MIAEDAAIEVSFPLNRPMTWDDLEAVPDDQHWRYQIFDGSLIVSPSPGAAHQSCVFLVANALHTARPQGLVVKVAPFDVVPAPGQSYQPDVLVARRSDVGDRRMNVAPLLAVEVLSPGTRVLDLTTKRTVYARIGVAHLWYVDPELPSVTALVLDGDKYIDVATAKGDEELSVTEPFPVTVVPSELLTE